VDALGLIDVVNGDDVGVIQRRSRAGFLNEPPLAVGISYALRGQDLERDGATQLGVLNLVNHTHAPAAELLQDAIVADGRADHGERTSYELHLRPR
jgi:hypothetical protein